MSNENMGNISRNISTSATSSNSKSPLRYEKDPAKLLRKEVSGSSTGSANLPRVTTGLSFVSNLSNLKNDNGMTVDNVTMYMFLATACLGACASGVASPFTVFYAKYFGADDAAVGLLQATYSVCAVGMLPVVGKISDTFGRKVALLFCQSVIFFGAAITTIAPDLQILFIGQFVMSAGITIQTVQEMYIADVTSNQTARKFWYRRFWMADTFPNLIAPPLGGWLGMWTLRAPWALDMIVSLVCMVITYIFVKETPSWLEHRKKEQEAEKLIKQQSDRRPGLVQRVQSERESRFIIPLVVWILVADGFFLGTANQGQNAMVSLWQQEKLNFDPMMRGLYYPSFAVLTLFSIQFITPFLHNRLGVFGTVILADLVSSCTQMSMGSWAGDFYSSLLCFWTQSMCLSNRVVTIPAIVARYTKPATRGKIFVALMISQAVGRVVSPTILGVLAGRDIETLPWFYLGICDLASCCLVCAACYIQPKGIHADGSEDSVEVQVTDREDLEEGDSYHSLPGEETDKRN